MDRFVEPESKTLLGRFIRKKPVWMRWDLATGLYTNA